MLSASFSRLSAAFALVCSFCCVYQAKANTINLVNGSFSSTNATTSSEFSSNYYPSITVTGWNSVGYNFIFLTQKGTVSGTQADNTGSQGQYSGLKIWGPGDGSNNGLTTSPDGGNFVGLDGVFEAPSSISQTISGLTVGAATTVSFFYAGAQQYNYTGDTTEWLDVSLGNQSQTTTVLNNSNQGFTGWKQVSLSFLPTSTTETLQFLAHGTPNGEPPFTLLDGVSVSQSVTPEPGSLALFGTGLLGFGGLMRRKLRRG